MHRQRQRRRQRLHNVLRAQLHLRIRQNRHQEKISRPLSAKFLINPSAWPVNPAGWTQRGAIFRVFKGGLVIGTIGTRYLARRVLSVNLGRAAGGGIERVESRFFKAADQTRSRIRGNPPSSLASRARARGWNIFGVLDLLYIEYARFLRAFSVKWTG